jgi:hypothetical protein
MNQRRSEVAQNAAELQQAAGRYSGVADATELHGATITFDPLSTPAAGTATLTDDKKVASGDGECEHDPDSGRLHAPVAARLDADNPPGPPAGMPLQDGR